MTTHTAKYKGHTIAVEKSWYTTEKRLIIDGELQDISGMVFESSTILWGRIKNGDGCGDIVKARLTYRTLLSCTTTCSMFVNDTPIPCINA